MVLLLFYIVFVESLVKHRPKGILSCLQVCNFSSFYNYMTVFEWDRVQGF
ncbi:hypothetical protein SDC9_154853 [bioreactor metagenome]|uniref:Uncharacterized protein n=1 Tax=bioreactor metagenome TaxID=1076179 RepID=A0A645F255_9ZZZZ